MRPQYISNNSKDPQGGREETREWAVVLGRFQWEHTADVFCWNVKWACPTYTERRFPSASVVRPLCVWVKGVVENFVEVLKRNGRFVCERGFALGGRPCAGDNVFDNNC